MGAPGGHQTYTAPVAAEVAKSGVWIPDVSPMLQKQQETCSTVHGGNLADHADGVA